MYKSIIPKLPMRNKAATRQFYIGQLGFSQSGIEDYEGYLMIRKDDIEIHFFEFRELDPDQNYGQIYIRVRSIEALYKSLIEANVAIHPAGPLQVKPWGQKEFSLIDPDSNLLTFGEPAEV